MTTRAKKGTRNTTPKSKGAKPVPRIKPKASPNDAAAKGWLEEKRGQGRPKNEVEKTSLHVYVPTELHRAARIQAFEEGRPMSRLVEQALADYLGVDVST